jgi:periplasmic copper chaperone A
MFAACFKRCVAVLALVAAPATYAELVIEDAWVRAVPPNSRTTAAYFTVRNSGKEEQIIVRVSASVAGAAEIHDWIETDGRKKMVRQHQVPVPAGADVVLQTGSLHMMLFRLDPVPAVNDLVRVCVGVENGTEFCADATVRHP